MKALGICVGASTIKAVAIDENKNIIDSWVLNHECNPKITLKGFFDTIKLSDYSYMALTGRKFKELLNLPKITEPEATEHALKHYQEAKGSHYNALISLGSENFILYVLNEAGSIIQVQSGNKCASGTGEFFLQQIRRMNVEPEEAIRLAKGAEPYVVSGRCSVFCKSDCTHALNKGIPIGRVCAGLGNMIADKIIELLRSVDKKDIIIVGGITKNDYVVNRLNERIEGLIIPENAGVFEAFGAALYAMENKITVAEEIRFIDEQNSFSTLPPLAASAHMVEFKEHKRAFAEEDDECILGLDVGSTTTKAVLVRKADSKIVASVYLRTNGDPVGASRACYDSLLQQLNGTRIKITGLGVTGSGRHIAGLHALTDGVINEIIAHATAAAFFDHQVDTIIEIGGQDAKYTHLVNGVPCDYAMNEACSAGTGSFLEEASRESLNIDCLEIQDIALRAKNPPNFNDQCAAFISSDIKNASHENIAREDIIAGLVYSICMNYNNRVKGSRKVGEKIFMQGGVCYNKAVPLAMATILGKQIVVPPEPGLMGAFGVALEIKERIEKGLMAPVQFSLSDLLTRNIEYGKSFICPGTAEHCDRGCKINMIKIDGKTYPFGGICNKYYNILHNIASDSARMDLVEERHRLLFEGADDPSLNHDFNRSVGIPKTFFTHSLFPLYNAFFSGIGMKVLLSSNVDIEGVKKTASSFCFPAEISHGMFMSLLKEDPDYIFLPHITQMHVEKSKKTNGIEKHSTCVLAQSEPYYLRSAFRDIKPKLLTPVLDFSKGWHSMEKEFVSLGAILGASQNEASKAFKNGIGRLKDVNRKKKEYGQQALKEIESDPSRIGIVLFGRAYNAFSHEANLGIPRKFASRGIFVIPYDFLSFEDEDDDENMTWATGQEIMKASRLVKKHRQLFGAFVTNFSCGPDSFLVGYFRDIMKNKPSLTLELDSHSADAGITTRVEAFLDIVSRYRALGLKDNDTEAFTPASLAIVKGRHYYVSSAGERYPIKSKKVRVVFPSMGRTSTELVAATFRGSGFNALAVNLPDFKTLMLGRGNSSCKECLPLILTTGSMLEYIEHHKKDDEHMLYFMPTTSGPCRFSQYYIFMKKLIEKKKLKDVALLTLTTENNYAGLPIMDQIRMLKSIIVSDVFDDIKNALLVLPEDKEHARQVFMEQWEKVLNCFENKTKNLDGVLKNAAKELSKIKLKTSLQDSKKVLMIGEIFVRRDEFSSQEILKRLAKRGIVVKRSPILEWMYYIDYLVKNQYGGKYDMKTNIEILLRTLVQKKYERKYKRLLAASGLYDYDEIDIDEVLHAGSQFIDPAMTGEAILGVGVFFHEIARHVQGVVSIGPFACLPSRVTESILSQESKVIGNSRLEGLKNVKNLKKYHTLPFISIESDGNPFPQIVEARIEAFTLQVERMHRLMNGK